MKEQSITEKLTIANRIISYQSRIYIVHQHKASNGTVYWYANKWQRESCQSCLKPITRVTLQFKLGLGLPTHKGRIFADAREQSWLDALPTATNDSHGYQQELNPGLLGASLLP